MFCQSLKRLFCALCVGVIAAIADGSAKGDVIGTYVDATTSNTTPSSDIIAGGAAADNLWTARSDYGVLESDGLAGGAGSALAEDAPRLTTTVTGLANGLYNVYLVYGFMEGSNWNIQGSLSGGTLQAYQGSSPAVATGFAYNATINQYSVLLGTANVTAGTLAVDIDDCGHPGPGDPRTWYDGISYQAVPEPMSGIMTVLGVVGLLAYAWKKRR